LTDCKVGIQTIY